MAAFFQGKVTGGFRGRSAFRAGTKKSGITSFLSSYGNDQSHVKTRLYFDESKQVVMVEVTMTNPAHGLIGTTWQLYNGPIDQYDDITKPSERKIR